MRCALSQCAAHRKSTPLSISQVEPPCANLLARQICLRCVCILCVCVCVSRVSVCCVCRVPLRVHMRVRASGSACRWARVCACARGRAQQCGLIKAAPSQHGSRQTSGPVGVLRVPPQTPTKMWSEIHFGKHPTQAATAQVDQYGGPTLSSGASAKAMSTEVPAICPLTTASSLAKKRCGQEITRKMHKVAKPKEDLLLQVYPLTRWQDSLVCHRSTAHKGA